MINLEKVVKMKLVYGKSALDWDANKGTGSDFVLDVSVFTNGVNTTLLQDECFAFYNNELSPSGTAIGAYDATITVDFSRFSLLISAAIFMATIHKRNEYKRNFGQECSPQPHLFNATTNEEVAKYKLKEDFPAETAVEYKRLYHHGREWKVWAMCIDNKCGLDYFVNKYIG